MLSVSFGRLNFRLGSPRIGVTFASNLCTLADRWATQSARTSERGLLSRRDFVSSSSAKGGRRKATGDDEQTSVVDVQAHAEELC